MTPAALHDGTAQAEESSTAAPRHVADDVRLRAMFAEHFDFIWRSLRRLGLGEDRADDAAQQVFMIASRKLDVIQPNSERSFLFGTAIRVASDLRRSAQHRREIADAEAGAELEAIGVSPDELLDQRRARDMLDAILAMMDIDLRSVFVLYEIEEMTTAEIAALLEIPHGTAQSRLRRAREQFNDKLKKLERNQHRGGDT